MAGDSGNAGSADMSADARARAVEEQMTDDERFSLLVSVMGVNDVVTVRDERIPEGVPMSAGYVPGVPRLAWLGDDRLQQDQRRLRRGQRRADPGRA
jgi:beta-glucosidase